MPATPDPVRTVAELNAHLWDSFPPPPDGDGKQEVVHLDAEAIRIRMTTADRHLRPGGTVAGPVLFTMADTAAWLLTLAHLERGRDAVTTGLSMHFLRRPPSGELMAEGRLLRMGRRFSVTDVLVHGDGTGDDRPVAQATVTYAPL